MALVRFDRNDREGGILLYIRDDIPAALPTISLLKDFEGFLLN